MKRLLCLWLPNWPIQRLCRALGILPTGILPAGILPTGILPTGPPEATTSSTASLSPAEIFDSEDPDSDDPLVVLHETTARGTSLVAACSLSARALGIQPGMPLAEAGSLVRRSTRGGGTRGGGTRGNRGYRSGSPGKQPSWQQPLWQPVDRLQDQAALEQLAQWCQQFSPLVALEETGPPEDPWPASLLLDVGGTAPRLGGEAALAAELHRGLRALGYTGRLAIADTLGAAWGLARFAQLGPDRTLIAPAGETLPALSRLSIAALRLPPQALERLLRLGITRVEQLISLPRSSLRSRLGPEVLQRVDQALGTASETLSSQVPMADFSASWDSVSPLESTELIQRILDRLCGQVASQLSQRRLGAVRLLCRLTDSTGNSQRLEVGFFQPTSQTARWQEVLALPIERLHPTHGIARIELLAHPTEPLAQHQRDLFASRQESAGERPQELAWGRLVERLAGRLGHHAVVRPRQVAHAQPELALGWDPVVGPGGGAARSPRGKHSAATLSPGKSGPGKSGPGKSSLANERCHHPLQRPLLLLRTAIALPTSGGTPTSPPQQFRWQGQWEMIVRHWGPERIETGWWRRPGIRRDYWRVETATGRRWWIYRDLSQPPTSQASWFLHGEFA